MTDTSDRVYLTPKKLTERYPTFNKQWLRILLWKRDENGLNVAVRKIGRKFVIDEKLFLEWVESHGPQVDGGEG